MQLSVALGVVFVCLLGCFLLNCSMGCFDANGVWTLAQFHGSAYRNHKNCAYGSREFCASGKRISRVSDEFWLLRVRTPSALAKLGIVIVSAEFGGKQSPEIGP